MFAMPLLDESALSHT